MMDKAAAQMALDEVQETQTAFWNALSRLESELGGIELESTDDFIGLTLDDLLEQVDGEGELENES